MAEQEKKQAKSSGNRLTPEQWEDAKVKWRSGRFKLAELSELYGVSVIALSRRFTRNGVVRGSDAGMYERKIAEAKAEAAAEVAAKEEKELRETASGLKKFLLKSADITAKKIMSAMAKASQENKGLSYIVDDAKAANEVTKVLKNISDIVERVVPASLVDPDDIPDLVVDEMDQKEIDDLQRQQQEEEAEILGLSKDEENEIDELAESAGF